MGAILFAQEDYTKHQLGMNASKFVVIFNEQVNNLDLTYRYSLSDKQRIRFASSIDVSTEEGDITAYEIRLGYDFNLKDTERWNFYTGFDVTYGQSVTTSTDRLSRHFGPYVFLGVLFKMGKHFSLSTEPSLAILRKIRKDPESFNPEADANWTEIKFLNVGQIKVGFHF